MKRLLLLQLIIFAFCTMSAAQTPEASAQPCPVISVTGPAGIVAPGEPVTFIAEVTGVGLGRPQYRWSVSKGKIVSGQGTESISMVYSGYPLITATVQVAGLLTGCPDTASEVYEFIIDPGPVELGEISGPRYTINKQLLARIGMEARMDPNAQIYVVLQFERCTPDTFMQTIRSRVAGQLKITKIDAARITFKTVDNGKNNAVVWLIRPGVDFPYTDPSACSD